MKTKLLILGDSPTVNTGFACVVRQLARRWLTRFDEIEIYGINYHGWPHHLPYVIYPAGGMDWNGVNKMSIFLNHLLAENYTHLFILCDWEHLVGDAAEAIKTVCQRKKIKLIYYYPVDAPLDADSSGLARAADVLATYTEYGRAETQRAVPDLNPFLVPHGVDTATFYPREDRMSLRQQIFKGWVADDDFLIVNVNRNEPRKAPQNSLEILKRLRDMGVTNVKLLLHMPKCAHTAWGELDLEKVGSQLGLKVGAAWTHNEEWFRNGNALVSEAGLNDLYNCADLLLTTSLGEGWGLPVTEALAAGCPVALPEHTSLKEIADRCEALGLQGAFTRLALSETGVVWNRSRLRYPVAINSAALAIRSLVESPTPRIILNDAVKQWLDWERIGNLFADLILT